MLANKLKGSSEDKTYIEDVFSTYLYTGNGSTQTINNGIDLAGNGGMVWCKSRNASPGHPSNQLFDSSRGSFQYRLYSDTTGAQTGPFPTLISGVSSSGFSLGSGVALNNLGDTNASWTFRNARKFFDVKTVTHTAGASTTVDLSSLETVGSVFIKRTDSTSDWTVWHRSLPPENLVRNSNAVSGWSFYGNVSVSYPSVTNPFGGSTCVKLSVNTTSNTFHSISDELSLYNNSFPDDRTYTISVYAKAAEQSYINVRLYDSAASSYCRAQFNLLTGACAASNVGTASGATAKTINMGNGWYRCILAGKPDTSSSNSIRFEIGVANTYSYSSTYAGTVGNGVYIYGPAINHGFDADAYSATGSSGTTNDLLALNSTSATARNDNVKVHGTNAYLLSTMPSGTYVIYGFAHDTTTDGLIQCGSFTASSIEQASVTLGWEPQYLLFKPTSTSGNWQVVDTMRRFPVGSDAYSLQPNTAVAEANFGAIYPTATGFAASSNLIANATYIYMAIRRGPMRTPTDGTKVFSPTVANDGAYITTNFPVDWFFTNLRTSNVNNSTVGTRLTSNAGLISSSTAVESPTRFATEVFQSNTGFKPGLFGTAAQWAFKRAPGFFDVVCYTGTGVNPTAISHNLGVVPELAIIKCRNTASTNWSVSRKIGSTTGVTLLNSTMAEFSSSQYALLGSASSTSFSVANDFDVNKANSTYVAYLFASCPGVSKVGSYTGNGTSQTINCGFSAGARFVLIKRTDNTGDWYVWDTARGIFAGTDPYLKLNTTDAEVNTNTDTIDPVSTGFIVNQDPATDVNLPAAAYIYLAIA